MSCIFFFLYPDQKSFELGVFLCYSSPSVDQASLSIVNIPNIQYPIKNHGKLRLFWDYKMIYCGSGPNRILTLSSWEVRCSNIALEPFGMVASVTARQRSTYPIWSPHLWGPSVINSPVAVSVPGRQPWDGGKQIEVSPGETIKVGRGLSKMKETKKHKQGHLGDESRRKTLCGYYSIRFLGNPSFSSTLPPSLTPTDKTNKKS